MQIPTNLPNLTEYAVPFFIATMIMEIALGKLRGTVRYETRDTAASLAMGIGSMASGLIFGAAIFGLMMMLWDYRFYEFEWSWTVIAFCFVLDDLRYYIFHRTAHERRWFWAEHIIHHSSQHYNLSTALRQSWIGPLVGSFIFKIPLVLMGFHPLMLAFVASINLVYQYWIHTESIRRLPAWFEAIFNTPSHHRVHHATNPKYLDANYAGTLIIWDKMFGSFVPEDDAEPCRYGIVRNVHTFNPLRIALHEFLGMIKDASMPGLKISQRLGYLFGPPGWSHDGSRRTSAMIKADFVRRNPDSAGQPGLPSKVSK